MSLNKIFIFLAIWFLFWVFSSNIIYDFNLILIFLTFIMVFFLTILLFLKKYHFFVIILVLWIFIWTIYYWVSNILIDKKLKHFESLTSEHSIVWKVDYLYKKYENYNSYIVDIISIDDKSLKWKFLLKASNNINLEEKENISLKSKIDKIDNFWEFNYKKFMLSKWVYFEISFPTIERKWNQNTNIVDKIIMNTRQTILANIFDIYPKNEWNLLAWILIWARENISKEMENDFKNSWLTHLMAVSWFNITIIIVFLWFLFKFVPVYFRFWIITLFIIFFTLIVWDNVAVFRASIMWILAYFILISGRKSDSLSLMLLTAVILVLFNPLYINYDVSFHLSFLAVLWLLYTKDFWEKIFFFLPKFFAIKESFVLTLSAMSTTLPIMVFNFWQISLLSPVSNMIVWWVIPISMMLWFLSIIWNIFSEKLWFILGFFWYFPLKFVNFMAWFFGNLNFSILTFDYQEYFLYLELAYFIILVFLIIYFQKKA